MYWGMRFHPAFLAVSLLLVASACSKSPEDKRTQGDPLASRNPESADQQFASAHEQVTPQDGEIEADSEMPLGQQSDLRWLGAKTVTVAPGVHVLGRSSPSAVFVIETSEGLVLIDSGIEPGCQTLLAQWSELGLELSRLRFILLTHSHSDHVFGAMRLREMTGAEICAGEADCEVLRTGGPEEAIFSVFSHDDGSPPPVVIDRELADGDRIVLGDVTIHVLGTPGHTPGSTCFLVEKNGEQIFLSGDTIVSREVGPAIYPVYLPPVFGGNAVDYLSTIRRLLDMPAPDMLLTGHPLQHREAYGARITPWEWHSLLERSVPELERIIARHERDGADFLDGEPKEILTGIHYLGDLDDVAVFCLATENDLVIVNAPGKQKFRSFLEDGLEAAGLGSREPTAILLTSVDDAMISGLSSCEEDLPIVAPSDGHQHIRESFPDLNNLVSEVDLDEVVSLPIRTVSLSGIGRPSLGYDLVWEDKHVLLTGRFPTKVMMSWPSRPGMPPTWQPLRMPTLSFVRSLSPPEGDPQAFLDSLDQLVDINPHVWLTANPVNGQNANLYDDEWQQNMAGLRGLAEQVRAASPRGD